MSNSRTNFFKIFFSGLLIALVSIVSSMILIEVLAKMFFPQEVIYLKRSAIWGPDDLLGHKHRSNLSTSINIGEKMVHFKTDENGFRIGDKEIISPTYKILALGDSFPEGLLVEHEETVTGRLESILSKDLRSNVQVVNTAVAGYGPNHYLLQAKTELKEEKYDLVLVFLYIGNDLELVNEPQDRFIPTKITEKRFRLPHKFSKKEFIDAFIYPVNNFLETHSTAFVLFKKRSKVLLMKLGFTASYFPDVFFKSEANSPRYEIAAEICSDIEKLALNQEVETVFVLIPTAIEVQEESFREYITGFNIDPSMIDINQPNRLLKRHLENLGLFVIDPSFEMIEEYNEKGIRLYDAINDHFTSEGHEILANLLAPALKTKLEYN